LPRSGEEETMKMGKKISPSNIRGNALEGGGRKHFMHRQKETVERGGGWGFTD